MTRDPDVSTTPDRSNSLADLAARIRAEHEASAAAMKRGCEHAINAGRLLIEAKDQLNKHGAWLPWLAEHCQIPERTAQLYMRLARHAPELEANPQRVADLTVRGAIELLAPPPTEPSPDWDDDDWSEWAQRQLDGPFTDSDFDRADGRLRLDGLMIKLMHQLGVPAQAALCISIGHDHNLPVIRLCPADELIEALRLIAPIATQKNKGALKIECANALNAWVAITIAAQRTFVILWDEIAHREKITDECYERECKKILDRLRTSLDERKTALEAWRAAGYPDDLPPFLRGDKAALNRNPTTARTAAAPIAVSLKGSPARG